MLSTGSYVILFSFWVYLSEMVKVPFHPYLCLFYLFSLLIFFLCFLLCLVLLFFCLSMCFFLCVPLPSSSLCVYSIHIRLSGSLLRSFHKFGRFIDTAISNILLLHSSHISLELQIMSVLQLNIFCYSPCLSFTLRTLYTWLTCVLINSFHVKKRSYKI